MFMKGLESVCVIVLVVGAILLLLWYGVGVYATVRHARYAGRQRSTLLPVFVPDRVALPDRREQEAAYEDARVWVDVAAALGVVTWLTGESLQAARTVGRMYPWQRHITFAYHDPQHRGKIVSQWPKTVVLRSVAFLPEQPLSIAAFGPLPAVNMHSPEFPGPVRPPAGTIIGPFRVPRRDRFDALCRLPHAKDGEDVFLSVVQ